MYHDHQSGSRLTLTHGYNILRPNFLYDCRNSIMGGNYSAVNYNVTCKAVTVTFVRIAASNWTEKVDGYSKSTLIQ